MSGSKNTYLANSVATAVLLSEMKHHAMTVREGAEVTGWHIQTVDKYLRVLHRHKIIYIADWVTDGRGRFNTHAYRWRTSNQVDKPKPAPLTSTERARRQRARRRAAAVEAALGVPVKQRQVLRRPGVASTLCGSLPSSTQCASAQSTAPST